MSDYPQRPQFFANKFMRLMTKTTLANDIGPECTYLLAVIANTEDAKRYKGAVTFFNPQLAPLVGARSIDCLDRIRRKCVEAGWLNYTPGRKSVPGKYWVIVPEQYRDLADGPCDENPDEFSPVSFRKNAEVYKHQAAEMRREAGGKCGEKPEASAERSRREPQGKCGPFLPVPLPDPSPVLLPENHSPTERASPHTEAVGYFLKAWEKRYGKNYAFNRGKDGSAFKWFLQQVSLTELKAIIDRYLADDEDFLVRKGHSVGILRSQFNTWHVDLPVNGPKQRATGNITTNRDEARKHTLRFTGEDKEQ